MNKLLQSVPASIALLAILAGCAVSTPYQRPDVALPGQWSKPASVATSVATEVAVSTVAGDWWKQFGRIELNQLIEQALAANHDLAAAVSRIQQARAAAGIAAASSLPSANLSITRSHNSQSGSSAQTQSSQIAASASYELDLWGGKAAGQAASRARLSSSIFDRDAVALVLQADVASNYFQALALKDRLAIARNNLNAARDMLALIEVRYGKGASTGLEISQQRTSALTIEAQIPQLEQDLRTTLSALAVLLGKTAQEFSVTGESLAGLSIPAISAYQPQSLLERRPDISKAEAQLVAAHADIDVARAALYPRVTLSGNLMSAGGLATGSGLLTSLVVSLTQSIFDGGGLRNQLAQSEARKSELVEQYLQSVLVSTKEVQDSLGLVLSAATRQALLKQATQEAREAYRIASVKYRAGSENLLTLLDSQRSQLQSEDNLVQADLARLSAAVSLYRSLGGGWMSSGV